MKITKEEILKLGQMSMIDISEEDMPVLIKRIEGLLSYVSGLKEIIKEPAQSSLPHVVNITREDIVKASNPEPLLKVAPQSESHYYIVPMVLKID